MQQINISNTQNEHTDSEPTNDVRVINEHTIDEPQVMPLRSSEMQKKTNYYK